MAFYLVLDRLDIAYDIQELIERIRHEAVAEHLNDAGKNSANLEVSLEEPEFVWTVLCQAMTQKSVSKADTIRTDEESEDQKRVNCVTVRVDDRVINVECIKQDVIALSATQSKSYTLITGEFGRVPSEDNETDLGTKYLERDRIKRCMTRIFIGVIIGEDPIEGHSWKIGVALLDRVGVGLLSCVGAIYSIYTCQLEMYM